MTKLLTSQLEGYGLRKERRPFG